MTNPLDKNIVNSVDALDMVLGSIAKPIVEKTASTVVGNGNFVSGVAKLVGAGLAAKYAGNNRFGKAIAIGAGMDGAEDLIIALGSRVGINQTEQTSAGVF
jgi:hypothetical protein